MSAGWFVVALQAQSESLPNNARAFSGTSVIYEFSFSYPDGWQSVDLDGVDGGALVETAHADTTIVVIDVFSAVDVEAAASAYPFPVGRFNLDADTLQAGGTTTVIRRGTMADDRATFIAAQAVDDRGNFARLQAVLPLENLAGNEATLLAILDSVQIEAIRGVVRDTNAEARLCNYDVTVTIARLQVVNAEEAGTGTDFDFDGDQVRITMGLGPILANGAVDTGLQNEFQTVWEGDLASGQTIDAGIGGVQRVVCEPNVGFLISLTEDDSTPFGLIETRMGNPIVLPILTDGRPDENDGGGEYVFSGLTQDGNYEYRVGYSVTYVPVTINAFDLTPTLPPTPTLTPSPTLSPTATETPSPTLTPSLTLTRTPSITPTASNTATLTPTLPPTATPTIDFTAAAEQFSGTQTAFAITQTAVVATFTPSRTPTPDAQMQFIATQTAFAVTQNAFLTRSAPTATPLPPTVTPSQTPTHTLTPTYTLTPTPSNTPKPTDLPPPTATPTRTPTPTATIVEVCAVTAESLVNIRNGPGTTFDQIGQMQTGERQPVRGQRTSSAGFIWWQISEEGWVREDNVIESGPCGSVPEA